MNRGAEALNNVLNILETMTVEEYERLYDDVCERYGDSEIVTILDKPTEIERIYNADEKVEKIPYV